MMNTVRRQRRVKTEAEKKEVEHRKKWEKLLKTRKTRKFYSFRTEVNMEQFFLFPKVVGSTDILSLSKSALAIYPVFCSLADFEKDNWFHVLQEDLARMSGIGLSHVRKGIEELRQKSLLKRKKITEGERHYYKYKVWFVRRNMIDDMKDDSFIFHTCIIESGVWAELTLRAKALYLALRIKAKFDIRDYCDIELNVIEYWEKGDLYKGELYRNRKWDSCMETISNLCKLARISTQNIKPVLSQLMEHQLIRRYNYQFEVYLKPYQFEI